MIHKEKKIECFVPALALQHFSNPEEASVEERIRLAVARLYINEDFYEPCDNLPYVFLEHSQFEKDALGYIVSAIVKVYKPVDNPVDSTA